MTVSGSGDSPKSHGRCSAACPQSIRFEPEGGQPNMPLRFDAPPASMATWSRRASSIPPVVRSARQHGLGRPPGNLMPDSSKSTGDLLPSGGRRLTGRQRARPRTCRPICIHQQMVVAVVWRSKHGRRLRPWIAGKEWPKISKAVVRAEACVISSCPSRCLSIAATAAIVSGRRAVPL